MQLSQKCATLRSGAFSLYLFKNAPRERCANMDVHTAWGRSGEGEGVCLQAVMGQKSSVSLKEMNYSLLHCDTTCSNFPTRGMLPLIIFLHKDRSEINWQLFKEILFLYLCFVLYLTAFYQPHLISSLPTHFTHMLISYCGLSVVSALFLLPFFSFLCLCTGRGQRCLFLMQKRSILCSHA